MANGLTARLSSNISERISWTPNFEMKVSLNLRSYALCCPVKIHADAAILLIVCKTKNISFYFI